MSERIDIEITGEEELDRYLRKLNLIITKGQGTERPATKGKISGSLGGVDDLDPKFVAYLRSKAFAANVFSEGGMSTRNLDKFGQFMAMNDYVTKRGAPMDAGWASNLPSFSREERIILNQVLPPGMLRQYYNIKRLQGGLAEGGRLAVLSVVATTLILAQEVAMLRRRLDEADQARENLIRNVTGMTHGEFSNWSKTQFQSYRRSVPF